MKKMLLTVSLLQLMPLSACAIFGETTLEFQNLQDFSLREERQGNNLSLVISGMSGSSALGVKRIDVVTKTNEIIVKPKMIFGGGSNLSASFTCTISVPPNIKRVLFGEEGYQIWPIVPLPHPLNRTPWLQKK